MKICLMQCGHCQNIQWHPIELFLKISVLQANVCWLGDLDKIVCPWKESDAGKLEILGV